MSKKPSTPSSDTATPSTTSHERIVNVDEQESSHEANMRTAANRVKISAKQPQKGRANKVLVSNRSKEPHAREATPTNRTSPHSEEIQCIITKGDLNSGQGLDPVPDLEQLLDQINIDIDSREHLKDTEDNPQRKDIGDMELDNNGKRIYRQAGSEVLSDPTSSPRAEVNRLTKLFSARIDSDLVKDANEHIKNNLENLGLETKAQWVEKAIRNAIQRDLHKLDR